MNRTRRGMYAFMQKHLQARPASRVDASEDFGLVKHMIEMHAPGDSRHASRVCDVTPAGAWE